MRTTIQNNINEFTIKSPPSQRKGIAGWKLSKEIINSIPPQTKGKIKIRRKAKNSRQYRDYISKTHTYIKGEEDEDQTENVNNDLCNNYFLKQIQESSDKSQNLMKNDKISYFLNHHQNHDILSSREGENLDENSFKDQQCKHFINLNLNCFYNKNKRNNGRISQGDYSGICHREHGDPIVINGSLDYARNNSLSTMNKMYKTSMMLKDNGIRESFRLKTDKIIKLINRVSNSKSEEKKIHKTKNQNKKFFKSSVLMGNIE